MVHVSEKTTFTVNGFRINFYIGKSTLKSVMCGKCTYIKSNSMCALSPIFTQESSQTVNGPISILKSIIQPEFSCFKLTCYFLYNTQQAHLTVTINIWWALHLVSLHFNYIEGHIKIKIRFSDHLSLQRVSHCQFIFIF